MTRSKVMTPQQRKNPRTLRSFFTPLDYQNMPHQQLCRMRRKPCHHTITLLIIPISYSLEPRPYTLNAAFKKPLSLPPLFLILRVHHPWIRHLPLRTPHHLATTPTYILCISPRCTRHPLTTLSFSSRTLSRNMLLTSPTRTWQSAPITLARPRISEARRFFSKASLMDPHSPAAWIGFAHTFAAEGEHDQAIAAYSTAARLFQGSHLPQLFLGMQHLALNNMTLAWEYCVAAYEMSSGTVKSGEGFDEAKALSGQATGGDPLVLNELGVILYHQSNLPVAVKLFQQSLSLAAELGCAPTAWVCDQGKSCSCLTPTGKVRASPG